MGVTFPLFESLGTSPDYHDFSNLMDSGFATSPASSFRTLRHIQLGLMDWSSMVDGTSFSWSLPWDLGSIVRAIAGEDWGKKVAEYISLLHVSCNEVPCHTYHRGYDFFCFPLLSCVPVESLCAILHIPSQASLQLCLISPEIPTLPGWIPIIFPVCRSLLPLSIHFHFALLFGWEVLMQPCKGALSKMC